MEEEIKLEPSEELAYWVGVVQTDGCLRKKYDKRKDYSRVRIELQVCDKSLEMIEKVRGITSKILDRHGKFIILKEVIGTTRYL